MISNKCPKCGQRTDHRTLEQNKRYWALVALLMEKGEEKKLHYTRDDWHDMLRMKFLGGTDVTLPNGRQYTRLPETHSMSVDKFGEFLDQVQAWAAEHDVYLDS